MKKQTRQWALFILVPLLPVAAYGLVAAARDTGEDLPAVIETNVEGYTGPKLWVSAKRAAAGNSVLDWSLLEVTPESSLWKSVERERGKVPAAPHEKSLSIRQIPESQCTTTLVSTADYGGGDQPSESFADLARHALGIYAGTISGIEPGFMGGIPATLLEVEIQEALRPSKAFPETGSIFVLHPLARFAIGHYTFCGGLSNSTFAPKAGDHVLLFAYTEPVGRGVPLAAPRNEQIFFSRSDGALFVSPNLRADPALRGLKSLEQVKAIVRELQAGSVR